MINRKPLNHLLCAKGATIKKLYKVGRYQELMVFAEDIEEAEFLFTENIDKDDSALDDLIAMETNDYPPYWADCIP